MKIRLFHLLFLGIFYSCANQQQEIICFQTTSGNYCERLNVNGTVKAENTTYIKAPNLFLSTIIWLEETGKHVKKGDTLCILEHAETQLSLENFNNEMEKMQAQLDKLQADHKVKLSMLEAEIKNNEIQLSINNLDSIQKRFAPPLQKKLISLEQEKAQIQKEKLQNKYSSQKIIGETEIRSLRSRIKQMENRIDRTRDQLSQLILSAPIDGIVIRTELPTLYFMSRDGFGTVGGKTSEGTSVWPNMNIMEIPDMRKMQVVTELSESQYKKVQEGQKVKVTVDAQNYLITTGEITKKSLMGKHQDRDSKIKSYEAVIDLDSCHQELTPGMNARCEIQINELTGILVVPAVAVFEENEEKYIYVSKKDMFRKVPVETGYSNSTYTAIVEGLPENALVALTRPSAGKIIEEKNFSGDSLPVTESNDSLRDKPSK